MKDQKAQILPLEKDIVNRLSVITPIFFTIIMISFIVQGGPLVILLTGYLGMSSINLGLNQLLNRLSAAKADPIRYIRAYINLVIFAVLDFYIPNGLHGWLIYIPFLMINAAFPRRTIHAVTILAFHLGTAFAVAYFKGEPWHELYTLLLVSSIVAVFSLVFVLLFRRNIRALEKEITRRKLAEEEISHLAFNDTMTGIANRRAFEKFLANQVASSEKSGEKFALLFIDLEEFKKANDLFGHHFGDLLLASVAKRLQNNLGENDMLARFGGDEFIILRNQVRSTKDAEIFAQKLNKLFDDYFALDGKVINIAASIGISIYPDHARGADELLKFADIAMYKAKVETRNHYRVFDKSISTSLLHDINLHDDLKKALKNDEFFLLYQPKVDTGEALVGFEALVRWQRKGRQVTLPEDFIGAMEKNRLIVPLGYLLLNKLCEQLRQWQNKDLPLPRVSINLSPYQMQAPDIYDRFMEIINQHQLQANLFELEVTESGAMTDINFSKNLLSKFKAKGMTIALDDFGKGFSSLGRLNRLPLDLLKIDKEFISNLDNFSHQTTVSSIIDLARNHQVKVLAEGVETREQYDFLKEKGCDYMQGFYFYKPLPAGAAEDLLIGKKP